MGLVLVKDKNHWDKFISGQPFAQFLQSWAWGEFQTAYKRRVWRVGLEENGQLVAGGQFIEHYLGLGMAYLYCPRGPVVKFPISNFQFPIKELTDFIKNTASTYGELFLRIEPTENIKYSISNITRIHSVQPSHTLLLDLSKSEDELLSAMHEKTRYNIRLAERKNLSLEQKNNLETIWPLMNETAKRDKIKLHPKKYYDLMLKHVPCQLFSINFQNLPLATGIFIGFGDTFTYVHGASGNQNREMMAPYLLQWQAIKFAKSAGYRYYDFGGINPTDESDLDFRPRWAGITRFKTGFNGITKTYPGTFDLPLNPLGYKLFRLIKKFI
jgi:lipid II:glycine glycyltransferase (peptidoglycan interpeptide bridge formation enzyme)